MSEPAIKTGNANPSARHLLRIGSLLALVNFFLRHVLRSVTPLLGDCLVQHATPGHPGRFVHPWAAQRLGSRLRYKRVVPSLAGFVGRRILRD